MNSLRAKLYKRLPLFILLTPILMWLILLIVLPHFELFRMSLQSEDLYGNLSWSLENYTYFFKEPIYWATFARTAMFSILVTFLTFLIALPVAFYITKVVNVRYRGFLSLLLLLPFWVSELVRIYGWMILLRESGVINKILVQWGIIDKPIEMLYNDATMTMGLVYTSMLFMAVPLISVLESLDDSLIEAAHDLGGNMFVIMWKIVIPHAMPGIVSGGIVVFMLSLGNYLTPNLLGGKNSLWFTEQIYNQFIASFNWNLGSAFGFLLLIISSAIIYVGLKFTGQKLSGVVQ